ncbi:MAG: hypothetical protein JXB85_00090 [Anaerolineales bacterium]|nr:hypothetical protein [Anaerolineales bacterium]
MKKGSLFRLVSLGVLVGVLGGCAGPRFTPLTADNCRVRAELVSAALGVEVAVVTDAPFTDPLSGDSGSACQITAEGSGLSVAQFWAAAQQLQEKFDFDWDPDPAYAASGPTGASGAFRKWNALCLWEASWQPVPQAECPADQPITVCELTPEQVLYHFLVQCALDQNAQGE